MKGTPIYNDDPNVLEQLHAKLASLVAERARIHAINAAIRKHGYAKLVEPFDQYGPPPPLIPRLTDAEIRALEPFQIRRGTVHRPRGFPPYWAANLSTLISKTRRRIRDVEARPEAHVRTHIRRALDSANRHNA